MKPATPEFPGEAILLEIDLPDPDETGRIAGVLAQIVRSGDILALWGDLGAGKTTFARGFIGALSGGAEAVPSPTFTLVQTYPAVIAGAAAEVWHFDFYRLKRPADAYETGIEEAFAGGISLIEWPDRLGNAVPKAALRLALALEGEGRRAVLSAPGHPDLIAALAAAFGTEAGLEAGLDA